MKKLITCSLALLVLAACRSAQKQTNREADPEPTTREIVMDIHNSSNSLDYWGLYEGALPGVGGGEAQISVTLNKDYTYTLKREGESAPETFSGTYSWDDAGSIITLEGAGHTPFRFQVREGNLLVVDKAGNPVGKEPSQRYVLTQTERF